MKILLLGDPHLKISNFQLSKNFLEWVNTCIDNYKPDMLINLGDTFNDHAVVRSEIMGEFIKHIDHAKRNNVEYIYIIGNHDMFKPKDAKYHALMPLSDKITIIDKVVNRGEITFVPYTPNPEDFPKKTNKYVFAHQSFNGANYGYKIIEDGVNYNEVSAKYIISGHIHNKQWLEGSNNKVFYVGSPYSQSVNDVDQVKGIYLFHFDETRKLDFIKSPFPMYKSVKVSFLEDDINGIHKTIFDSLNKEDYFIIDIKGTKEDISRYISSKSYLSISKEFNLRIRPTYINNIKKHFVIKSRNIEDIVTQYISNIYDGNIPKDELIDNALNLIKSLSK